LMPASKVARGRAFCCTVRVYTFVSTLSR
jgi:hypothetical protein